MTLTVWPSASALRICSREVSPIVTVGIVAGMSPDGEITASSRLPMMTATAPAASAFSVFWVNGHRPRSTITIFPATSAALSSGEQPSVVVPAGVPVPGSSGSAASVPTTTSPVRPVPSSWGP